MAHSYTPGLTVAAQARVIRRRVLPIQGQVMVEKGQAVTPDQVVARTDLPGDVYPINVANLLGVTAGEVKRSMLKKEGDPVTAGETMAVAKSFFGLFSNAVDAPRDGVIESISSVTGQVIIRGEPLPVTVKAYIAGKVTEVFPGEGVTVSCAGSFIQGIFGVGGEVNGAIRLLVTKRHHVLTETEIDAGVKGCIVVAGRLCTAKALRAAREHGAVAVVTGGFDDKDLREFLGHDLGVAITGQEQLGISLMVTEGFGPIEMADRTFDLLRQREGMKASLNGATQIRAGVIRPEIIVPLNDLEDRDLPPALAGGGDLRPGHRVRCIRSPYFGRIGVVTGLPSDLRQMESGTRVRVLELRFNDGETAVLPRANTERMDSERRED